jgi:molecular chaperone GrpE
VVERHPDVNPPEELEPQPEPVDDSPETGEPLASDVEFQQLKGDLEGTQDRLLRAQAELENFRRRVQRERQEERRFASQALLTDLLPVLDNMERAIEAAKQSAEGAGLLEGFKMVYQQLLSLLEKHHCIRVEAEGSTFDPARHEAMMQEPSDEPKGTVTRVLQQGYLLHDRVIRPSQVIVSNGLGAKDQETDQP